MSTKVYDGFRFTAKEFQHITQQIAQAVPAIEALQKQRFIQTSAHLLVSLMDSTAMALATDFRKEWSTANFELAVPETKVIGSDTPRWVIEAEIRDRRRRAQASPYRDPAIDWAAGLQCWWSPCAHAFIGYPYGELGSKVLAILKGRAIAKEFGYWNNTDEPEGMSEREWNRRRKAWDEVLDHKGAFQFDFPGTYTATMSARWEDLAGHLPVHAQRVSQQADNILCQHWLESLPQEERPTGAYSQLMGFKDAVESFTVWSARRAMLERTLAKILPTHEQLEAGYRTEQPLLLNKAEDQPC